MLHAIYNSQISLLRPDIPLNMIWIFTIGKNTKIPMKMEHRPLCKFLKIVVIIQSENIVAESDWEDVNDYLSTHIIHMDFDDELLTVNDGEQQENLFFHMQEEDKEKEQLNNIVAAIEYNTDTKSVVTAGKNLIKKKISGFEKYFLVFCYFLV